MRFLLFSVLFLIVWSTCSVFCISNATTAEVESNEIAETEMDNRTLEMFDNISFTDFPSTANDTRSLYPKNNNSIEFNVPRIEEEVFAISSDDKNSTFDLVLAVDNGNSSMVVSQFANLSNINHPFVISQQADYPETMTTTFENDKSQCESFTNLSFAEFTTVNLVRLSLNFSKKWESDGSFERSFCDAILQAVCSDALLNERNCSLKVEFVKLLSSVDSRSISIMVAVRNDSVYFSSAELYVVLKEHQDFLEQELGLHLLRRFRSKTTIGRNDRDFELLTGLIVASVVVCIVGLGSLLVLIIWQQWKRQFSGEWVLHQKLARNDKFDVMRFENQGYVCDDKSQPNVAAAKEEEKIVGTTEMCVNMYEHVVVEGFHCHSDEMCLVPKEMMELFETTIIGAHDELD